MGILQSTLFDATQPDHVDKLLESGADIERKTWKGLTPLIYFCCYGPEDVAIRLIEKGADCNATSSWVGVTPLMYAAQTGRLEVVKVLIEKGVDLNFTGVLGITALMMASCTGQLEVVQCLVEKGASVHVKSKDNWKAYDYASTVDIKNFLRQRLFLSPFFFSDLVSSLPSNSPFPFSLSQMKQINKRSPDLIDHLLTLTPFKWTQKDPFDLSSLPSISFVLQITTT